MKCFHKSCSCGMQVVILTDTKESRFFIPGERKAVMLKDPRGRILPVMTMNCQHCTREHWIQSGQFLQHNFMEIKI